MFQIKTNRRNNLLFSLLSGTCLILGFSFSWLSPILLFAWIPMIHILREEKRPLNFFLFSYLAMFIWIGGMNASMILSDLLSRTEAIVLGVLVVPLIWSTPFLLVKLIMKKQGNGAIWLLPFFWTSLDVLQYYWPLSSTWQGTGYAIYSWAPASLSFIGIEGLSFILLLLNVVAFRLLTCWRQKQAKALMILGAAIVLGLMICWFFPVPTEASSAQIAFLQLNDSQRERLDDDLMAQVQYIDSSLNELSDETFDVFVCPEGFLEERTNRPLFTNSLDQHPAVLALVRLAAEHNCAIISGASLVQLYRSVLPPTLSAKLYSPNVFFDVYNGSLFVTPEGRIEWRSKQALVPVSEQIPFYQVFNSLEEKGLWPIRFENSYATTELRKPYEFRDLSIAPLICFEAQFPTIIQDHVNQGANVLLLLSSAWSNSTGTLDRQVSLSRATSHQFQRSIVYCSDHRNLVIDPSKGELPSIDMASVMTVDLYEDARFYARFVKPYWWFIVTMCVALLLFLMRRFERID